MARIMGEFGADLSVGSSCVLPLLAVSGADGFVRVFNGFLEVREGDAEIGRSSTSASPCARWSDCINRLPD